MDSFREAGEEFAALGLLGGSHHFFIGSFRLSQTDIFQKAYVKQKLFLGHIGDLLI